MRVLPKFHLLLQIYTRRLFNQLTSHPFTDVCGCDHCDRLTVSLSVISTLELFSLGGMGWWFVRFCVAWKSTAAGDTFLKLVWYGLVSCHRNQFHSTSLHSTLFRFTPWTHCVRWPSLYRQIKPNNAIIIFHLSITSSQSRHLKLKTRGVWNSTSDFVNGFEIDVEARIRM